MDNDAAKTEATSVAPGAENRRLRFELRHIDSAGKVLSQQSIDDPDQAMRGFADLARSDFGPASGRGAHVELIDSQDSRLAAATTHEGRGAYQTRFVTDEGRKAFEALEPPVRGVTYPVEHQAPKPAPVEPAPLPRMELHGLASAQINASRDLADRIGVTTDIERLSFEGKNAASVVKELDGRLVVVKQNALLNQEQEGLALREFVRHVRASLGVPSVDLADEYAAWHRDYIARSSEPSKPASRPAQPSELQPEAIKASAELGEAAAAAAVNSIEFVSEHELSPGAPSAALLREARERQAMATNRPDPAFDTIARMSEPELEAYVGASKRSRAGADEVLRKVEERIVAEADQPGTYKAVPPLEDRFNVRRRLFSREYEFRDQAGKIAFTETLLRMQSTVDSPAVVKAMVERARERGWTTLRVNGSLEFERQVWITATARGIKAVGYEPTEGDRLAVQEERSRLAKAPKLEQAPAGGTITRKAKREPKSPGRADPQAQRTPAAPVPAPASPTPERPIVAPLRRHLDDRGESAQAVEAILAAASRQIHGRRVYVGTLKEAGTDHFDFDKKKEHSPFVRLESSAGEKVVWGVDLPRALEEGRVKVGDAIALEHRGMQPVTVAVKDRDAQGRVVDEHEEVATRNTWFAIKVEQLREQALGPREVKQERAPVDRSVAVAPVRTSAETPTDSKQQVKEAAPPERNAPPAARPDAMVFELLEAAFEAKKIPLELRDGLRAGVRKELDVRYARGETISVKIYDPAAPSLIQRPFQAPQPKVERQREPDRGR